MVIMSDRTRIGFRRAWMHFGRILSDDWLSCTIHVVGGYNQAWLPFHWNVKGIIYKHWNKNISAFCNYISFFQIFVRTTHAWMEVVASIWQKIIAASASTDFMGETVKHRYYLPSIIYLNLSIAFLLVDAYSIKGKENLSLRSVREPRGRASPYAQPPGTITIIRY